MLDVAILEQTLRPVIEEQAGAGFVERLLIEPAIDSEGDEAIRIRVITHADRAQQLSGDRVLNLLVAVHHALSAKGEDRLPMLEYATEGDLREEHEDRD